jgi:cytochrome P450
MTAQRADDGVDFGRIPDDSVDFAHIAGAFRSDPHSAYRMLREQAPVAKLPGRDVSLVSGYRAVRDLLRDPRAGAEWPLEPSSRGTPGGHRFVTARADAQQLFASFMSHRAPSDHARLRRLVRPAFSATQVDARRATIQRMTDERIDEACARGAMDVVGDLGRPVALNVAADLLGIPQELRVELGGWARDLAHVFETFAATTALRERGLLAMLSLDPCLRELIAGWREHPPAADNLLWAMARAEDRGELSADEVVAHGALLLLTGHLTTQHLIGNGVLALLRNPDQWSLLRAHPELIAGAVEELLRYDTPAPVVARNALADIVVGGRTIAQGESLVLLLAGAHRDPAIFADPDRLDITRSPNPHLGFGYGAHSCVGAALARLEAQIVIGTLVRRVSRVRLETESLEWEDTFLLRGLTSLPILLG